MAINDDRVVPSGGAQRPEGRSAVVTGAGSGLGRDLALGLAAKGYRVFGTAMAEAEVDDLARTSAGRVTLTRCDITDEDEVRNWAKDVTEATGRRLDLLISNAGILSPGPVEVVREESEAEQEQFLTQLLGLA
jgi:NAD(P)-dependent dehydrogenase (short-subunit alcohol dehydrogenase family)